MTGWPPDSWATSVRWGARVRKLAHNMGKGVALRTGLEIAKADIVVVLDADGQDDPADIPRLVDALVPGVDMVIGSRFLGHFEPGAITLLDWVGNRALTGVLNLLYGVHLTDTQAGFRAMRRASLERAHFSTDALGSCDEVRALLEAAVALGVLSPEEQQRADALAEKPADCSPTTSDDILASMPNLLGDP